MNTLFTQLKAARQAHRENKDQVETSLLGCLIGDLQNATKGSRDDISDVEVTAKVKSFLKLNLIALEALRDIADRTGECTPDQAQQAFELGIEQSLLHNFIPKQLTETELVVIVEAFIESNHGADMGEIMKHLREEYNGCYDGRMASSVAKSYN